MITRDPQQFLAHARTLPVLDAPATARACFLVAPDGFALAAESARDNRYMDLGQAVDPARALAQHRELQRRLATALPCIAFPGDPGAPDGVFPNNVFATAGGRLLLGHMRHPVRRREAARADIRGFFAAMGYGELDLGAQPGVCELTGSLVVDHARGIGFIGLGERCDATGAAAMHAAFGLRASLLFDLAPGEYHTNVVLAVLAGRAALVAPSGFADPAVPAAIADLYAPAVVSLDPAQKAAFAGNAIALGDGRAWFSARGLAALTAAQRATLVAAGLVPEAVALDEIEKAGGSLRCCVAEIF